MKNYVCRTGLFRRLLSACGCSAIASATVLDTGGLLQSNLTTRRPLPGVTPDTST